MNRQQYIDLHKKLCAEMVHITKCKNEDYAGAGDDPFSNFRQIGTLLGDTNAVKIGFLTRMSDKMSRIGSFIKNGTLQVKEESAQDTLLDLANYCLLFIGYLADESERLKRGLELEKLEKDIARLESQPQPVMETSHPIGDGRPPRLYKNSKGLE